MHDGFITIIKSSSNVWDHYYDQSVFVSTIIILFLMQTIWNARKTTKDGAIPMATGSIPIFGHAISYSKDPSNFLIRTRHKYGSIFQLNLAGKIMILVCGPNEQKQLAKVPESILSLQHAVADIGFEQTLGARNVYKGTNLHKGIMKGILRSDPDKQLTAWISAIKLATKNETKILDRNFEIDFFYVIRRIMLRATIEVFIGTLFLQNWEGFDFLMEYMNLQDSIEDVTAKAVILPKLFALITLLWPLQRRREALQLIIQKRLENILQHHYKTIEDKIDDESSKEESNGEIGFWLRAVLDKNLEMFEIAEYIVGLLFAGHKNSAIGSAQSYLLMQQYASDEIRVRCQNESKELLSVDNLTMSRFKSSCPTLRRICLESLRLTAHSIGGIRICKKPISLKSDDGNNKYGNTQYNIPKGSTVGFVHIASSLDTSLWGNDAKVFDSNLRRPESLYNDDYTFTVFSHGVHKCPGRDIAMIHLQVVVAVLLTGYDVLLPGTVPNLCFERATLAQRKGPVMVSIIRKQEKD